MPQGTNHFNTEWGVKTIFQILAFFLLSPGTFHGQKIIMIQYSPMPNNVDFQIQIKLRTPAAAEKKILAPSPRLRNG